MTQQKQKRSKEHQKAKRKGFIQKSPAICVVVHDLGGMAIPDKVANEILDAVTEKAVKYGYVINYTRT